MLRADLHIHTAYSMDCSTSLEQVIDKCEQIGINCVAIADHGTAAGGLELQKIAPFKVVAGQEILTCEGEIIGLFLKHDVPTKLPVMDAIAEVKKQGGLVCLPHPCDRLRESLLKNGNLVSTLLGSIDIIETFNSRTLHPGANNRAKKLAKKYGIVGSAGSDAHTPAEIGNAFVDMPDFNDCDDFLAALSQGSVKGRSSNPLYHFSSIWSRLTNILS